VVLWVTTAAGSALVAAAATVLAIRLGGQRARPLAAATLVGAPLLLFSWKVGVSASFAGAMASWPGRPSVHCLGLAVVMGAASWSGWFTSRSGWLGGALGGVAAGAASWTLLELWCPVGEIGHLLLGHVAPLLILAAAGAASGRWATRPA
jgi:hypothetical protein